MKNFLKIFFIVVCFLVTLGVCKSGVNIGSFDINNKSIVSESISVPHQVLVSPDDNESQIAASNSHNTELTSANLKKNSHNITNIDKVATERKIVAQIFALNYKVHLIEFRYICEMRSVQGHHSLILINNIGAQLFICCAAQFIKFYN